MRLTETFFIALLLLAVGCRPQCSQLQQAALELRPGMAERDVKLRFLAFDLLEERTTRIFAAAQVTGDSVVYGYMAGRNQQGFFENCKIWFSTNNVILAYRYQVLD
jgi:hypothetical protein